jgi:hypothetical protein
MGWVWFGRASGVRQEGVVAGIFSVIFDFVENV